MATKTITLGLDAYERLLGQTPRRIEAAKPIFWWCPNLGNYIQSYPRIPLWERSILGKSRQRFKRKTPLTVCIAAICENGIILGASDRMLTSGDIEYEPAIPTIFQPIMKVMPMSSSIIAMTAGDAGTQAEILAQVFSTAHARIEKEPNVWLRVQDMVDVYIEAYNRIKLKAAVSRILSPLGLDEYGFIARQKEMADDFIKTITAEMVNFELPDTAAIFTGVDNRGAHIYCLYGNQATCCDSIGFAAIGIGARHAQSQFMLARHSRQSSLSETLLLIYSAKKRSEVAPGVGKETDMFTIGPRLGSFSWLHDYVENDRMQKVYEYVQEEESKIAEQSKAKVKEYVDEITARAMQRAQQTAPEANAGTPPPDGEAVQDDPEKS